MFFTSKKPTSSLRSRVMAIVEDKINEAEAFLAGTRQSIEEAYRASMNAVLTTRMESHREAEDEAVRRVVKDFV